MRVLPGVIPSLLCVIAIARIFTTTTDAAPPRTGFSYQGVLSVSNQPANGDFELQFALYTDSTRGVPVAGPVTTGKMRVNGGLFTTSIDFGLNVYDGTEYWLETGVRPAGATIPFTTLSPRQLLTPTPYALYAAQAGNVPAGTVVRSINGLHDDFTILGDGVFVDTVGDSIIVRIPPPDCLTYSNCYWNLRGNGNIAAGTHFLGTVAGELAPLEFRVNNNRSFRHDYTGASTSPNLIGGFKNNVVSGTGGTISGGGQQTGINQVLDDWGTVGGGYSNVVQAGSVGGAIGGGATNWIAASYGTVGGGAQNVASNYATISGGSRNRALSSHAAIGGGELNTINPLGVGMFTIDSSYCTIGGGVSNAINGGYVGTIGGGRSNTLVGTASLPVEHGTIGGGEANTIRSDQGTSAYSTIGGGFSNRIQRASSGTIAGGRENTMLLEGNNGTIGGGQGNILNSPYGTISGGRSNLIGPNPQSPDYCTIGGGRENSIIFEGHYGIVGGGQLNRVEGFARYSAILGGITNVVAMGEGGMGSIGGGSNNLVNGVLGTIPGGVRNTATNMAFAAGRRAQAINVGSFVLADSNDFDFASTAVNQFNVRATGGTRIVSGIDGAGAPNAGVRLDPGAVAWAAISDRAVKKNVQPVDTEAVLAKLADVPVQQWNYNWEADTHPPHLGPMAQDFKGAFYPGEDNKVITTLEFDGVALAAIQGLNRKLEQQLKEKDSELATLRRENERLSARQEKIEKLVESLLSR